MNSPSNRIRKTISDDEHVNSLTNALHVLNDAADNSAEEIRSIIDEDFSQLKNVLSETKSEAKNMFNRVRDTTTESVSQMRKRARDAAENVDRSAHQNPWAFLAGAATASLLAGIILGRKSGH